MGRIADTTRTVPDTQRCASVVFRRGEELLTVIVDLLVVGANQLAASVGSSKHLLVQHLPLSSRWMDH